MWPRTIEMMLALWLAISPFIFRVPGDLTAIWAADLGVAFVVFTLACFSFWHPTRRAHLFTIPVALALGLWGYLQPEPIPPAHQNHVALAFLLIMHAIMPSEGLQPPEPWRNPGPDPARR